MLGLKRSITLSMTAVICLFINPKENQIKKNRYNKNENKI